MNWCFPVVVLEKTLQSPLDCKEIKPVNPKGNQPWIFIGSSNTSATWWEELTHGKNPDAGKDWRQKENRVAEDEMVRITDSTNTNLSKLQELAKDREAWCAVVHGVTKSRTRLSENNKKMRAWRVPPPKRVKTERAYAPAAWLPAGRWYYVSEVLIYPFTS